MRVILVFLYSLLSLHGGTLRIDIQPRYDDHPLTLNSLKYGDTEIFSVTRLASLFSEFSLQKEDGTWLLLPDQFAYIDASKRRTHFTISDIPSGNYQAIRFSIGVPKKENHANPAELPAKHPLNPNLNQLHWDWTGGYIFLALEGRYRTKNGDLKGYVYHLANDNNLTSVQLPVNLRVEKETLLGIALDVQNLLSHPRPLSFENDRHSTHSHPGDPIASALVSNLQSTLSILGTSHSSASRSGRKITPKFLPKTFTPHPFKMSKRFPRPALPMDNPLLTERVELGKKLFFDPILSADHSISCASCHDPKSAFTDPNRLSRGVNGALGTRNSMPLFNLAWKTSFFWDGRAPSLREQVLDPIHDHRELASHLPEIIERLNQNKDYQAAFAKAFSPREATSEKLALALENYLLTLTSYDSKFDRAMAGKAELTASEQRGMELFFTENEPRSGRLGADCFHCHGGANFSDHQLHNNGLKPFDDLGRFTVTEEEEDKHLFSTPSLRNITLTAPYMHDGRFETLEEVIDHYSGPMHRSKTLDPNLAKHPKKGFQLSERDKSALVDFLKTLTDPKYDEHINNISSE